MQKSNQVVGQTQDGGTPDVLSEIRARWSRPSYDPEYWGDDDVRWLISEVDRLRAALGRSVPAEPTPPSVMACKNCEELRADLSYVIDLADDDELSADTKLRRICEHVMGAEIEDDTRGAPPQGEPPR